MKSVLIRMARWIPILILALTLPATGVVGCKKKAKPVTPIPPNIGGVSGGDPSFLGSGFDPNGADTFDGLGDGSALDLGDGGMGEDMDLSDGGIGAANRSALESMTEDAAFFAPYTLYFGFDSAVVQASETSKIEAVAAHLQSSPTHGVRIEGHCDERGTEGYNMSLGERRAQSVREYLVNLGVDANRIGTLTWGEQRPAVEGRTEAAYGKNRRAEFVLLTP
jgi:peptidoglycan-associated lipoprotein